MMGVYTISILAILLRISAALNVSDECSKSCETKYQDAMIELSACMRGCRLSNINQLTREFVNQDRLIFYCAQDCNLCYGATSPYSIACRDGCKKQSVLPMQSDIEKVETLRMKPMMFDSSVRLHQYCYQIFSSAVTYIGITTYSSANDEQAMVVKIEEQEPMQGVPFDGDETMIVATFSDGGTPHVWSLHPVAIYRVSNSWIGCVATKVGLPKWAIASILIMSLVTVFYLCCNPLFDDEEDDDEEKKVVKFTKTLSISANDIERKPLFTIDSHQANKLPEKLLLA